MQIRNPKPTPKKTTVELTREDATQAVLDYVKKKGETLPTGKLTLVLDKDYKFNIMNDKDRMLLVVEEPVE